VGAEIRAASNGSRDRAAASKWTRWGQLGLGIICLMMIANLQYGWTLFIEPIDAKHHWGRAAKMLGIVSIGDLVKHRLRDAEMETRVLCDAVMTWRRL
jgi:hypothetical protein